MAIWGERKADRVAEALLRRITRGELAPGSLLPREPELAVQFEVNRSVVREALRHLEAHGLVRPIKRRGTEVLDPLESASPDVLRAMLQPQPGMVDRRALAELLEVRTALDVEMSGLAAARRTDDDLARLDTVLKELRAALGAPDRYAAHVDALTFAIARATGNRIYQQLVRWHHQVRGEVAVLGFLTNLANEPHLQGTTFLVDLIRARRVDDVRAFVAGVHAYITPRVLAAADLANGVPLDRILPEHQS